MKRGRKIKFRAWDPDEKIMANVRALVWNNGYLVVEAFSPKENELTYVPPFSPVVMQFTGLHDRNGKEIYEGDIIWWGKDDHAPVSYVFYNDGAFKVSDPESDTWELLIDVLNGAEVIGNIYENPELLTA